MADLWYCTKCKTLFSGSHKRRCGCGGRIHKTSRDMEKAYQKAGYQYDKSSQDLDFTAQLGSLADRILEEEKTKEKKSLFSDFDADMKKISTDLLGQLNTKKPDSKKKKTSKKKTSNKNTSKSNKNTSNAAGPENQDQEENFTLISGITPPNLKAVPSGESAQKSKKRKKTAAVRRIPQPPHRVEKPEKAQKEEHKETIDARTQLSIMGLRKKRG